jgi:hypothetical protein
MKGVMVVWCCLQTTLCGFGGLDQSFALALGAAVEDDLAAVWPVRETQRM